MKQVIGVDVGGTAIKLGRFTEVGECLASLTVPTPQPQLPEPVLKAVVAAIQMLDPDGLAAAVGLGTPGPACPKRRTARIAINLPEWIDVPVADWLEPRLDRPVTLGNDANCAGLGEAWLGAGRHFQHLILLTLGTGCGGCVILNGELFTGHDGAGGELGLVTVNPDGPPCNSGNSGSLEQYVSIGAVQRETGLDPVTLMAKAEAGDEDAIAFWQRYGQRLGIGLVSALYILNPEAVIIGGGISAAAPWFLPATEAEIHQRIRPHYRRGLQIRTAALGNQAGTVGAARLALSRLCQ
ncbi:MAG: ROK family protein [Cyanobacteria bacterium J06648_16]